MIIGINAGHTITAPGTGAVGYLTESKESRKVSNSLIKILNNNGHKVINCTVDKASSTSAYLSKAVKLANAQQLDLFISIHFNAGGGKGVEAYTWKGQRLKEASCICENINKLGFKNRGVKDGSSLYVIKKTKAKAILLEVCFVDSKSDADLYNKLGADQIAKAIYKAIC